MLVIHCTGRMYWQCMSQLVDKYYQVIAEMVQAKAMVWVGFNGEKGSFNWLALLGADSHSKLIHSVVAIAVNMHDSQPLPVRFGR